MQNSEQSGSNDRADWPVRLATGVGTGVGSAIAVMWRPVLGWSWPDGFWPGMLGFCIVSAAGAILGRLAGSLLLRRPPGR